MDITTGNCCCNSQVIYTVVYDKIVSSKMTPESALLSLNRTCTSWASESWYLWQGCHSETACIQGQQHKATVPWALERVIQTLVIFHYFLASEQAPFWRNTSTLCVCCQLLHLVGKLKLFWPIFAWILLWWLFLYGCSKSSECKAILEPSAPCEHIFCMMLP